MNGNLRAAADPTGLWATLSNFPIGSRPSAFERRLADANGWSDAFAVRVIGEYRRFLYLATIASFEVTPSKAVDEAWHLHLEDEDDYHRKLCANLLGRTLRHLPGSGDADEEARFADQYRRTLTLYQEVFGSPPDDIWRRPQADDDQGNDEAERRNRLVFGTICAVLAATSSAAIAGPAAAFLVIVLVIGLVIGIAVFAPPMAERRKKKDDGGSCGGSGCSTSDSGGSDGDCASCGGSCGGGCGGGD
ncbi:hypothetical protein [Sphingosinicella sp. BN140058]|uniref:glycine-rich domain-containing protein n=1 Tax=Sphingosinicella sp. BN140058 TaxID=1892855 RepID=UPI0010128FB7|nr:hypothetical protein [Sphingosinicella sp. BN140058]QAY78565.1 hypothetical protein ETR14_19985 [Sphingosinicella sp. BN140058]